MKLLFISLFFLSLTAKAQESSFHLCYFSLNNEKEFTQMEEFTKKINAKSNIKITVSEHLTEGDDPEESFKAMIEGGTKCDGLVISGHHSGAFGGKRARGSLQINFLEKLSCDEKYASWFSKIHALWLQGCRTLGVGKIETAEEEVPLYDPDYHTQRVGAVLNEDNLEQSFAELNMEFSATLDQDNPLSARYLRLFPKAKVFGWTKTAPGKNAQSERSIPFHIAHTAQLLEKEKIEDPLKEEFSKEQAREYLDTMSLLLSDLGAQYKGCEDLAVEGWLHHGQKYGSEPYSLNNPDLQAYQKLSSSSDDFMRELKIKECALKNAKTKEEKLNAITALTQGDATIQNGFNAIWERLQEEEDPEIKKAIQENLKNNPKVMSFLDRKLGSKQLGLLRKIDYYGFYKDLMGQKNEKIEELIFQAALKQINSPLAENNYAAFDYRSTLIKSISKNGLLNYDRICSMLEIKNLKSNDLSTIASGIISSPYAISNLDKILEKIIDSEKSDASTLQYIAESIGKAKNSKVNVEKFFEKIIDSEKSNTGVFGSITIAIAYSETPIPNADKLLEKIIDSEKSDGFTLASICLNITSSKNPIANLDKILEKIINSEKSDAGTYGSVAEFIGRTKNPVVNAEKIFEKIINSKKSNAYALSSAASAIGKTSSPIPNADKFLEKIFYSEKSDAYTLGSVAYAIGESKNPIANADKLLEKITDSEKGDVDTLIEVVLSIGSSTNPIPNADKLLEKIINSEKIGTETLKYIANQIGRFKYPMPNADKLLEKIVTSEKCDAQTLESIVYAIKNAQNPVPNSDKLLQLIDERKKKLN